MATKKKVRKVQYEGPMCDYTNDEGEECGKPATCNYQDAFIRWSINKKGDYCKQAAMEIVAAGDETNVHLCDEHDDSDNYA